jgi:hypothetical protein
MNPHAHCPHPTAHSGEMRNATKAAMCAICIPPHVGAHVGAECGIQRDDTGATIRPSNKPPDQVVLQKSSRQGAWGPSVANAWGGSLHIGTSTRHRWPGGFFVAKTVAFIAACMCRAGGLPPLIFLALLVSKANKPAICYGPLKIFLVLSVVELRSVGDHTIMSTTSMSVYGSKLVSGNSDHWNSTLNKRQAGAGATGGLSGSEGWQVGMKVPGGGGTHYFRIKEHSDQPPKKVNVAHLTYRTSSQLASRLIAVR